ncbi:Ig-like domain-containing protein [Micromonospora sp. NPDC050397]|uniref:Ig-like domain-containing protein n=1 Tax=Micromonospora sp. NPDC050397 TaxID=3364279 RepID=UPI003850A670
MSRSTTFAITVLVTALAVAILPSPARAGAQGATVVGDVNGDGINDLSRLVALPPAHCGARVQLGRGGGAYAPATTYSYLRVGSPPNCPDIGAAANLDGDPADEIAAAWFAGPPPGITYTLLVLDGFRLARKLQGQDQPSFMEVGDFNGDGRDDIYQYTDQGDGLQIYHGVGGNNLVRGPSFCTLGPTGYQVRDMHRDRTTDLLITYGDDCTGASGVTAMHGTGRTQVLQRDGDGIMTWTSVLLYANGDGLIDVRTVARDGRVTIFYNSGDGTFSSAFRAVDDQAEVRGTTPVVIRVRDNDHATPAATVTVTSSPRYGTAVVLPDRTVRYTPAAAHGPSDSFTYRLTEGGRTSTATVRIQYRT